MHVVHFAFVFRIYCDASKDAAARAQAQEHTCGCLKYFENFATIAVGDMGIDITLLLKLRRFIEEHCIAGLCSVKGRGVALTQKRFQMAVKVDFNSLLVLNKKIKVCLGWDVSPVTGHVVS